MSDLSPTYIYPLVLLRGPKPVTGIKAGRPNLEAELAALYRLPDEDAGEIMLVRHAEPNEDSPIQTANLSITGRVQAHLLAGRLAEGWVEAIYCAPERCAVETARMISNEIDRPFEAVADLRDIGFSPVGCDLQMPVNEAGLWDAMPGFEGSDFFRRRVVRTIETLQAAHAGRRIVIVTHAAIINAYLGNVLDIKRDVFFHPNYASISTLRWLDRLRALQALNDTAHLTGACSQWLVCR